MVNGMQGDPACAQPPLGMTQGDPRLCAARSARCSEIERPEEISSERADQQIV